MFLVSRKIVFIKIEAMLLYVYLCGNVQGHWQLQSSFQLFHIAFTITRFSFYGALFKCILPWE